MEEIGKVVKQQVNLMSLMLCSHQTRWTWFCCVRNENLSRGCPSFEAWRFCEICVIAPSRARPFVSEPAHFHYTTTTLLLLPSTMAEITTVAALYLLWKTETRLRAKCRRRFWVHDTIRRWTELSEFHRLLQELRLDDGRFQQSFRLTVAQFEDLLARVGARISRQDTNYRHSISAAERLSICLR